jgi:hypothetical protein
VGGEEQHLRGAAEGGGLGAVDPLQLERVLGLLRDRLPRVFEANRYFEERTGFHNEAGTNNLVDALSHFSTLVEQAEELGPAGQAEQVAMLEDHLRRSMMEAFEQVLKFRLADVAELWEDYFFEVRPLFERGAALAGARAPAELLEKREEIAGLLEEGRQSKRMVSWSAWEEGTGALVRACELTEELQEELEVSILAAQLERARRKRRLLLLAIPLITFALGLALGILVF